MATTAMPQFWTAILACLLGYVSTAPEAPTELYCKVYRFSQDWNYETDTAASEPVIESPIITFRLCNLGTCIVAERIVGNENIRRREYFHDCLSYMVTSDFNYPDCLRHPHLHTPNVSYSCCNQYRCHLEYPVFNA